MSHDSPPPKPREVPMCTIHDLPSIKTNGKGEELCQKCLNLSDHDLQMLGIAHKQGVRYTIKTDHIHTNRIKDMFRKKNLERLKKKNG